MRVLVSAAVFAVVLSSVAYADGPPRRHRSRGSVAPPSVGRESMLANTQGGGRWRLFGRPLQALMHRQYPMEAIGMDKSVRIINLLATG